MKRFMCMFFALFMCLGFAGGLAGCKGEGDSPPAQTEKITPRVEETIPPRETAPAPAERQPQGTEVTKVAGAISTVNPDTGKVRVIEKKSGKTVTLTAGSDVDLKDFSVGDQVVVEYTPRDMVIRSITK